jgi:hypothetical protein
MTIAELELSPICIPVSSYTFGNAMWFLPARACILPDHHGRGGSEVRRWKESSTVGVLGCFFVCIGLLLLAVWIAWTIMEAAIPG